MFYIFKRGHPSCLLSIAKIEGSHGPAHWCFSKCVMFSGKM